MTINDVFDFIGNGFHYIGSIRLWALAYWLLAGPLLLWAWGRVAESIYVFWWVPRRAREQADQSFNGTTIDL